MSATTLIRPGILVAIRATRSGGVTYRRIDLQTGKTLEELRAEAEATGTKVPRITRWETTAVVDDPEEYERANAARSAADKLVRRCCLVTSFGLLCPVEAEAELDLAIERAGDLARAHNATAAGTRVTVHAIKGRIAGTDEQAARAISREMGELVQQMNAGIDRLDPEAIRDAATRAQTLGAMLTEEQAATATAAIEAARRAARQITSRVEKKGEEGAIVLLDVQRGAIERARMAFLDLSDAAPVPSPGERMPAADLGRFAGLAAGDEVPEVGDLPRPAPREVDLAADAPAPGTEITAPARVLDLSDAPAPRARRMRSSLRAEGGA